MDISDIVGGATNATATAKKTTGNNACEEFLSYMQKSPAERMLDTWLGQKGITKEQWEKMSPEEKQKLIRKMEAELEQKLKIETEKKSKIYSNIL